MIKKPDQGIYAFVLNIGSVYEDEHFLRSSRPNVWNEMLPNKLIDLTGGVVNI